MSHRASTPSPYILHCPDTGVCKYDNNCQFAHGIPELRPKPFDANYKTELCEVCVMLSRILKMQLTV